MIQAKILSIDDKGNAVLNIDQDTIKKEGIVLGDAVKVTLGDKSILSNIPFLSGYYCKVHETVILKGHKHYRLAVKRGDASTQYRLTVGAKLDIKLESPKKYWEQENAYSFREIVDENRYLNKETFANFRPLFEGGSMFFRSASPFDNTYGKIKAVRHCIDKYSIRTIIDVADTPDELKKLIKIYPCGAINSSIYPIGNDAGLYSKEYESTIIRATEIIVQKEGPFLIHCRAGKRRSGFLCAILQGLAGVDYSKITAEYMLSYANNNGITQATDPQRFDYLKRNTIEKFLNHIQKGSSEKLSACVETYLGNLGLSSETISRLSAKLAEDKDPH